VVALTEPAADLAEFPTCTVTAGVPLFRVHHTRNGWLWFSTSGNRFDLPSGTFYGGLAPLGPLLETARGLTLLSEAWRDDHRLTRLVLSGPLLLADTTNPAAYRFGVRNDIAVGEDYTGSVALAAELSARGADGICYYSRYDVTASQKSVALFGTPYVRRVLQASAATTGPIPDEVLRAARPYGIRAVADLPPGSVVPVRRLRRSS
jgi:hypothetical protein